MSTEASLESASDRVAIRSASGRQIQARDSRAAPPGSRSEKPTKDAKVVFYKHESKDAVRILDEEFHESNYVLKDVKVSKSPCCENCGAICKPRKCSKCQRIAYCSTECQRADWPTHKVLCKVVGQALAPSDVVVEKAVIKLSARMMADREFNEQMASMVVMSLDLHNHPERGRTHLVRFEWDLVPLRTAEEYLQDRPAKERVDSHGRQRYMLELVGVHVDAIAERRPPEREMLATRRDNHIKQNRARLRDEGAPEDCMDDCHHLAIYFQYSKFADQGGMAYTLFLTANPGLVALKYAAVLGDVLKLMEASKKTVNENDYLNYAIRLLNSQIVTSQTGRNFRTSISLDELGPDD